VAGILDQRITGTGVAVGTLAYMAPEQLRSLPVTPRTDLYSLGCLLYEMLSGEPVFVATSPAGLIRMHLEQAPMPLHRDDLHPWLQALVWQLLEKDPARRPADALETYDRLLPYVEQPGPLGDIDPRAVEAACRCTHVCWYGSLAPTAVYPGRQARKRSLANPRRSAQRGEVPVGRLSTAYGWCQPCCSGWAPGSRSATSPPGTSVACG
jgi:hypothetical protein